MNIYDMKKEDFEKVPESYSFPDEDCTEFIGASCSLVIIPQEHTHDESGWPRMDYVAVDSHGEPICRFSGGPALLTLNGEGWDIDCLPCGYLRLYPHSDMEDYSHSIIVGTTSLKVTKNFLVINYIDYGF